MKYMSCMHVENDRIFISKIILILVIQLWEIKSVFIINVHQGLVLQQKQILYAQMYKSNSI